MVLETSISEQLYCCLLSLIYGVLSGVLYDAFRILYMCVGIRFSKVKVASSHPANKILLAALDILFSLLVTVGFVILMYAFSYGKPRLVYVICASAGAVSYMLTLGRLVAFTAEIIVTFIKKLLRLIMLAILKPFMIISKLLASCLGKLYDRFAYPVLYKIRLNREKSKIERIIKGKLQDYIKL